MKNSTLLAALLSTLGICWIVFRFGHSPERVAGAVVHESELQALIVELGHLRRSEERTLAALERLLETLALPASAQPPGASPASSRVAADGSGAPSFDELIASLDAMRAAFETESSRTRDLMRTVGGLGAESLVETRRRNTVTQWPVLLELERVWRADSDRANRSQYFQSAQDLLEAYGPPTEIFRPQGGVLFYYRRHPAGGTGPAWYFRLQDGIVIEFWVEDEVPEVESE